MKYLVTGATGAFGSHAVETLLKSVSASDIIACVRDKTKAEKYSALGVEVRQADFDDVASLEKAFVGVDRILVVSTNEPVHEKRIAQHTNAINAAKKNGVALLVYTSGTNDPQDPTPLAIAHIATEKVLKESGVPYCILRNNSYLETEIPTIKACMAGAPLVTNAGNGKVGFALKYDYAEAAASALLGSGNENTIYELSGEPVSYDRFAKTLGDILGKEIPVRHLSDEEYAVALRGLGMSEGMIPMLVATKAAIRKGSMEVHSADFERLLGRAVTPLEAGIKIIISALSK